MNSQSISGIQARSTGRIREKLRKAPGLKQSDSLPTIRGFTDYRKREYCNDVKCPVQLIMNRKSEGSAEYGELRELCQKNCLHTTHEFHKWLIGKGFLLVKPENTGGKTK